MKEFYTNVISNGNSLCCIGYNETGKKFKRDVIFYPEIYTLAQIPTEYIGTDNKFLKKHSLSIKEYHNFKNDQKQLDVPLYGEISPVYQFINSRWGEEQSVFWNLDFIKTVYIDIEVFSNSQGFAEPQDALYPVTSITIKDSITKSFFVLSTCPFETSKCQLDIDKEKIQFKQVTTERELLELFIHVIKSLSPDIITGWNVQYFDIPYLTNRICKVIGSNVLNDLSPIGHVNPIESFVNGSRLSHWDFHIPILDYLDLYKKYVPTTRESYSLSHISQVELNKEKVKFDEDSLDEFYLNDKQKFVEYNIYDVELVYLLEEKLQLLNLATTIAYTAKVLFCDIFSAVKVWDVIVYNEQKKRNLIVPPFKKDSRKEEYPGGYVREPQIGFHDWVISYDVNSEYPNVIIDCNISPQTLITDEDTRKDLISKIFPNNPGIDSLACFYDETKKDDNSILDNLIFRKVDTSILQEKNLTMTANLQFYRKDQSSIFGDIMETIYNDRVETKKKMKSAKSKTSLYKSLDLKQQALKILLNSGYGAFANEKFRYFDIRIASAITCTGQYVVRFIEEYLKANLKDHIDVVYCDTDSEYISCSKLTNKLSPGLSDTEIAKFVKEFGDKKVSKYIEKAIEEIYSILNVYKKSLVMKQEVVGKGLFVAKKKYIIQKYIDEDIICDPPTLKVTGIEIVRSSTPQVIRTKLKEIVNDIFLKSEEKIMSGIKKFWEEYDKMKPDEIAFPRSVQGLKKYGDDVNIYAKATPIHVRGSLLYNYWIKKLNLLGKYRLIQEKTKIKFIYLKTPNKIGENVIAFLTILPPELGLDQSIDYETQFEKTFLHPLDNLGKVCGWTIHDKFFNPEKISLKTMF